MDAQKLETPTDVLISAMEDIEAADKLMIVWLEKNDDGSHRVNWRVSKMKLWEGLGLIEAAKTEMVLEMSRED